MIQWVQQSKGSVSLPAAFLSPAFSTFFVDFLRDGPEDPETGEELASPHIYEPVKDLDALRLRLNLFLGRFNEAHKLHATDIVLFDDALLHFMRICRII